MLKRNTFLKILAGHVTVNLLTLVSLTLKYMLYTPPDNDDDDDVIYYKKISILRNMWQEFPVC